MREEQSFIIITITEIMGTSWGMCCFCPGFQWLGSRGTCGDYLATRSNWEARQIMPKSLLLARISLDITDNLPPRAPGQLNKAPAVAQRSGQEQSCCQGGDVTTVMTSAVGMELGPRPRRILLQTTAPGTPGAKIQPSQGTNQQPWKQVCSEAVWPRTRAAEGHCQGPDVPLRDWGHHCLLSDCPQPSPPLGRFPEQRPAPASSHL